MHEDGIEPVPPGRSTMARNNNYDPVCQSPLRCRTSAARAGFERVQHRHFVRSMVHSFIRSPSGVAQRLWAEAGRGGCGGTTYDRYYVPVNVADNSTIIRTAVTRHTPFPSDSLSRHDPCPTKFLQAHTHTYPEHTVGLRSPLLDGM